MTPTLYESVCSVDALSNALDRLRRNSTAAGVDDVTPARFREHREQNLGAILGALASGTYQFQALRPVVIPKETGGHRLLAIPTVTDRIVQKALLTAVAPYIAHLVESPGSHAYLTRRGLCTAVNDVKRHIKSGNRSIVQTDIIKFFDKIRAEDAIRLLREELPDDSLDPLLNKYVGWEIEGIENLPPQVRKCYPASGRTTGLPQGTALAPILANLILSGLDREARSRGLSVVRYADDIVLLAPTPDAALDAFDWYREQLKQLHLEVHDPRSTDKKAGLIADVAQTGLEYLGCFIKEDQGRVRVRPQESKVQSILLRIEDVLKRRGRKSLPQRILEASQVGEAWIASYRSICGMKRVAKRLSSSVSKALEDLLEARGILATGRTLNGEQREFLGLRFIQEKGRSRPSRAIVRRTSRSRT